MNSIQWEEVAEAATGMMSDCPCLPMLSLVENGWRQLAASGLTVDDTDLDRVVVKLRLAAICCLCYDFATIAFHESGELIGWVDWMQLLGIDRTYLGLLLGPESVVCESDAEDVQRDAMQTATLAQRRDAIGALCRGLGGKAKCYENMLMSRWTMNDVVEEYERREASQQVEHLAGRDADGQVIPSEAWAALAFSEMTAPIDDCTPRAWVWWDAGAEESFH